MSNCSRQFEVMHPESTPVTALFGIPAFSLVLGAVLMAAIGSLFFGISRWRQPRGKPLTITAGIVLLLFLIAVICVLITVSSGSMG